MRTFNPAIRPIPTDYNGYHFRGRLEARWAVFMDFLGVPYQYEPETFRLATGRRYRPDFWLPTLATWLEIKPADPFPDELDKVGGLAELTGQRTVLLFGDVWPGAYDSLVAFSAEWGDESYRWCICRGCQAIGLQYMGAANRNCACTPAHGDAGYDVTWPFELTDPCGSEWWGSSVAVPMAEAFRAAKSYHFGVGGALN